ncbi:hypothetical protein A8B82_04350 [Sulfitobacter sp. EhC04]|uniref:hypothetical protein n=1 Tax=Sulfitobacter sp. EhC04 TaxID=1849168 RepID=UPI0007F4A013|nr:hypothetical protein [Sulfitobacter sp. EhC04]OAN71519.1 hypothetical protein A8B82_04350 [Sulfitobacter sp. EhC04]
MRLREIVIGVKLGALLPVAAQAHVSEQGFVLLLPTEVYTAAGVAAVTLTVLALFALPGGAVRGLFAHRRLAPLRFERAQQVSSVFSLICLLFVLYLGFTGPRDPLSNLMPLGFWTLGWVAAVSLSGVFGNLWHWINPWTGLYHLLGPLRPLSPLPERLGLWPAVALLLGYAAFLLADIAPDDPARLARFVAIYWVVTFAGMILCGPRWQHHAELGHAIFAAFASLAPLRLTGRAGLGGPGWRLLADTPAPAAGVFALTLLAVGSFDGLNGTFWWLGWIGVNPLEFPGRSAVVVQTLTGLALAFGALLGVFALAVWLGMRLARAEVRFAHAFGWLALSLLPIALVYHIAHYLTAFLVQIQYTVAALSDPFARGADWLGIEPFRVTTGFFNSIDTVRLIWTTQAGLVVLGHVWSVLLSHRIALRLFGEGRRAAMGTLPLSIFMIAYTMLGLWLLAAPKGA